MTDDREFTEYRGDYARRRPVISFREYVQNVLRDPTRVEETKTLINIFGQDGVDAILAGRKVVRASDLIAAAGAARRERGNKDEEVRGDRLREGSSGKSADVSRTLVESPAEHPADGLGGVPLREGGTPDGPAGGGSSGGGEGGGACSS